jgi:hypothetical protein
LQSGLFGLVLVAAPLGGFLCRLCRQFGLAGFFALTREFTLSLQGGLAFALSLAGRFSTAFFLGDTGFFDLLGDSLVQARDQVTQPLVIAREPLGLPMLLFQLRIDPGQYLQALFLLHLQGCFLFRGLVGQLGQFLVMCLSVRLQARQFIQRGAHGTYRFGLHLGDIAQIAQVAAYYLGIIARQQRRPGRQAAGILCTQLIPELLLALFQQFLLFGDVAFDGLQFALRIGAPGLQPRQCAIDGGDGGLGRLEFVCSIAPRRFTAVDVLLQAFNARAQFGLLLPRIGLPLRQRRLGRPGQAGPQGQYRRSQRAPHIYFRALP